MKREKVKASKLRPRSAVAGALNKMFQAVEEVKSVGSDESQQQMP